MDRVVGGQHFAWLGERLVVADRAVKESKVGDVLFHELGHHIHFTHRPHRREKEDVADVWKVRLQKRYTNNRFWWMATLGRLLRPILGSFIGRKKADAELRMLRTGQISRVEYEEATGSSR